MTVILTSLVCACALSAGPLVLPRATLRGKWVLDAEGKGIPPGSFTRGLQPSGLLFRKGELWSVGDQRSEYPGHVFRIDPATARLIGRPIRLEVPEVTDGESPELETYRGIRNSDFEGLALDPRDPDRLLAVTEDKVPWIVEVRLSWTGASPAAEGRARIARLTRFRVPGGVSPWRANPNYAVEGLAVSDDGKTVYLAYERAQDELPRIYRLGVEAAASGKPADLEDVPLPFASVPRREDKQRARLNVNDIQFLRHEGRALLLAVLRDQERLLVLDLERRECSRVLDLELLDPEGGPVEWVSPEGIAFDAAADRLWLINDPDSVEGNYRTRGEPDAKGRFAEYSPLLYELKLSSVLGEPAASK
ncbi:MAG: esterase-like activity of phytase family protein [Planctomycetes bacterium]|nr:esterase-like activity of phytase family protein [Planctomycetota bacterium]